MEDDSFDYGLDPGESFIPDDDEFTDLNRPHIMTVLGPIDPGALGPVNLAASFVPRDPDADLGQMLTEIHECAAVGLNALVDLRPLRNEMEARAALWLAERCDVHLIVATGPNHESGAAASISRLIEHASIGMNGTEVRPGLIVAHADRTLFAAWLGARDATGLPLVLDARASRLVDVAPSPDALIACTAADVEALSGHIRLLDVEQDQLASVANEVLLRGIADRSLVFGYDPESKPSDRFSRWSWFIEEFPIVLMERGLTPDQVRALLFDAPARLLTIDRPEPGRC